MSPPLKCTDDAIRAALAAHNGNATRAARDLGVSPSSVLRRAKVLGLATRALGYRPPYERPTKRQAEVARAVVMLGSATAAADALGVSPQAVRVHLAAFQARVLRMLAKEGR